MLKRIIEPVMDKYKIKWFSTKSRYTSQKYYNLWIIAEYLLGSGPNF